MRKRLGIAAASFILMLLAVQLYPVEGAIWRASQVERLALVAGDKRTETTSQAAISEAMAALRQDRLKRPFSAFGRRPCRPQDLQFLVGGRWISTRVHCPNGLFLDFLPRPWM